MTEKGAWMLDVTVLGTALNVQHEAQETPVGGSPTTVLHDQDLAFGELRLDASYALTDAVGVEVMLPVRWLKSGVTYRDLTGAPIDIENPDVHHRDETLTGVGDPWLLGQLRFQVGSVLARVRAGITVPLGRTEENPFALGDMGIRHQHSQFGTGTVDPLVAVDAFYPLGKVTLLGYALTRQTLYENDKSYQAGDRYAVGAGGMLSLGERAVARLGLDFQVETAELWGGERVVNEGNQGRTDLMVALEGGWRLSESTMVRAAVRIPLVTEAVGGELDYPAIVEVGFRATFGGGHEDDHDHDHEHDHDDHHHHHDHDDHGHSDTEAAAADWTGVDMVEVAGSGEAVDLEPVAGKVTVFDFWAPWCKPCKELDRELSALGRAHPDGLAIRKINVVDWDSAAARRYLTPGGFNLPHIKVYAADGTLLFERSGDPHGLADAVRAAVIPEG